MSFEGIVCPVCQADKDFTQVEPDTYYCSFHKGLFKYVDPRRLTVKVEGDYCRCGNLVQSQCQLCEAPLCDECDIITIVWSYGTKEVRGRSGIAVRWPDFGYLCKIYRLTVVDNGRIVSKEVSDPSDFGPILLSDEILPSLTRAHGPLRHLCPPCLTAAAPIAASDIASGATCEVPGCGFAGESRCPCCGCAFCQAHVANSLSYQHKFPFVGGIGAIIIGPVPRYGDKSDWDWMKEWRVEVPAPLGFCGMCAEESFVAARELFEWICKASPQLNELSMGGFPIFGVQADGFGRRSRDANSDRRRQWHDMVNAELGKIRYPVAACRRGRVFTSLEAKRQTWMPNSHRYVLVRDHDVPPRSESQPDHKSQL
jgi:hypothetical protein